MLENLFVPEDATDVKSSEIELSEDVNSWPMEIQNAIYSSIPLMTEAPGQLFIDTIDRDKLYAKGSFVVQGPDDDIIFPIIVKSKQLQPIDLYIYKGEWHPVDAQEVGAILTSAAMGTKLVDPRDIPPTALSGLLNRITPPGGYGTGVVSSVGTKFSSARPDITEKIISAVKESSSTFGRLLKNANTKKAFVKLLDAEATEKQASNPLQYPSVILSLGGGKFAVKFAEKGKVRSAQCTGDELAGHIKTAGIDPALILPALTKNKFAVNWNDEPVEETRKQAAISEIGTYKTTSRCPMKTLESVVIGCVKTASGAQLLAVNDDGTYSLQERMLGVKTSAKNTTESKLFVMKLAKDIGIGDNIVVPLPEKTAEQAPVNTLYPVGIRTITNQKLATVVSGMSEIGKVAFIVMDGIDVPIKAAHVPGDIVVDKLASAWYVPSDYPVFNLPKQKSELIKTAEDLKNFYSMNKMASGGAAPIDTVRLWRTGQNSVAVKVGAANPKLISNAETMLFLKEAEGSGVMESMSKIASGEVKVLDMLRDSAAGNTLNSMGESELSQMAQTKEPEIKKKGLQDTKKAEALIPASVKVASMFDDEEDVNTVLSLNYITPENMQEFKDGLPEMKKTESNLSKLLMSTRLGNTLVDEQDVKTTLDTLHNIIKEIEGSI